MSGTLLFVHGTGAHRIDDDLARLRAGLASEHRLRDVRVHAVAWGSAVGPADLDVTPVLPPHSPGPETAVEVTPAGISAAEWDLLLADPLLELRMLAELFDPGPSGPDTLDKRLDAMALPELGHVDRATLVRAIAEVRDAPETADAALAAGDTADPELCSAVARAITATALIAAPDAPIGRDGAARDELAAILVAAMEPEPEPAEGLGETLVRRVLRPLAARLATRSLARRRTPLMDPVTDFVRDVAFYLRRGAAVRALIAAEAARAEPPVVLLGHSLGGIAAADLLSGPDRPAPVRLLVTAGSQAPYLYLMDALDDLRPGVPGAAFMPWLNVYDRSDLLAFCAARVFPGAVDEEIDAGVPFPAAHGAYWDQPRFHALLAHHWPG
ncbi:hypothetical protein J2S43_006198 [Catenuloplanes nepalensis]|uniref:AB hydrolase-1 domain-containing protein n=1 Tax=Catenuloplanes nepalensis TaxID=587533 RepID=A0ABT9N2K5_9ACTN|nr:hypothetical protein [Catenuloplanes nepalensis]MDP9797686.1 hypothetical protein [Catenuloplanes nepalensis]